ncbi:MAG TPA: hypothetical protein VK821_03045 [Dehalococcoidia bacterium]|nr:hypothetical protein [Dehalococcoidia bacterium]
MTSESGGSEGRQWLVEPPGPQQISLQIAGGDELEITPDVQAAFDAFVQVLRGSDVQGYLKDPSCTARDMTCTINGNCHSEYQHPNCLIDYHCQIGKIA